MKRPRLIMITTIYWVLLLYIIAALVWWFISLEKQNKQMYSYRLDELKKDDPAYIQKRTEIEDAGKRKTSQYIGEGSTFLLLILVGAVFVYRATRRQLILSRQQQNFMMAVTHELKTPIAVTRLNLETLQKRRLDETQQQKLIANTLQEANRLNILTNNILVASQLDAGAYTINKQELNISELAEDCVRDFNNRYSSRCVQQDIEEGLYVEGETLLLQMLINNLIYNALKYSPRDAPEKLSIHKKNTSIVLSVTDEGQGIEEAEKKKVFDKFYRTGSEATRTAKGTGLGLYLCKKIAADHTGSITVTDNHPRGSIFTVVLQNLTE